MPNTWSYYRNLDEGEAEELTEKNKHPCIEGELYCTNEYGDVPCWVEITIRDESVLAIKMARGIVQDVQAFQAIQLGNEAFDVNISEEWGNHAGGRLKVYAKHAWVELFAKHTSEMLEINVSDQIKQVIGE